MQGQGTPNDDPRPTGKRGDRDYKKRRVLGLAAWKPQPQSWPLIDAIDAVLAEYRDFWPLTARQVHYRLIGIGESPKTKDPAETVGRSAQSRPTQRTLAVGGDP